MSKRILIWIFALAAVVFAISAITIFNFSDEFSRNSINPDLTQFYWVVSGFGATLLFLLCVGCAVIFQLLKESEA